MRRRGEPGWEWIVNRDEHGYPISADIVRVTEAMAAAERAEMEAEQRARRPVMADLVPWLEERGGKL